MIYLLTLNDLKSIFAGREEDGFMNSLAVMDQNLYEKIEKLTGGFKPSIVYSNEDKRWIYFYLPLRDNSKKIAIPFAIAYINGEYWIDFRNIGRFVVGKGDEHAPKIYYELIDNTASFEYLTDKRMLEKLVPLQFRTGMVKRKYVERDEKFLSKAKCQKIQDYYLVHLARGLESGPVSLKEYLNTAEIAYRAAFNEPFWLTGKELYEKYANPINANMLGIEDVNSKEAFMEWIRNESDGAHPFEIVYSSSNYGIELVPPLAYEHSPANYVLLVGTPLLAREYVDMLLALIASNVPVSTDFELLQEVLQYLSGEIYYVVNKPAPSAFQLSLAYPDEHLKHIRRHIKWDELEVLRRK